MFDVSINNVISLTRGDSFTSPLFLNAGTRLKPVRYFLKDGREITTTSTIATESILAKGTLIKSGSNVNENLYENDVTIDNTIIIRDVSTLTEGSIINNTSIIKKGSVINDEIINEDLTIFGDQVYLGITEPNQPFEQAIVKKVYTSKNVNEYGDVLIKITPDDTECLTPGKYYYQIKAKFIQNNGDYEVNTVVPKTEFWILD